MKIENKIQLFINDNKSIVVDNNEDVAKATACIKGIKGLQEEVNSASNPIIEQAHKAHKEAISQREKYLKPLMEIERKFKDAILVFNRKLEEEQRKRVKEANERLEKQAEERRQELLREAAKTTDAWDKSDLKEQAEAVKPITCDAPGKVIEQEGLSIRKTWKAKVVDINIVPKEYLIIEANMTKLNQFARENKNIRTIPGVEFFEETSTAVR